MLKRVKQFSQAVYHALIN